MKISRCREFVAFAVVIVATTVDTISVNCLTAGSRSSASNDGNNSNHSNGRDHSNSRNLMVNGVDAKPYQFSFHTQIGCCSGALIAPDVVITASHDVPRDPRGMAVTVNAFYTDNSKLMINNAANADSNTDADVVIGVQRMISESYRHPKSDNMHFDFTVLILDHPVYDDAENGNDNIVMIRPIRINRSPDFPAKYQRVTLLGMGTTNLTGTTRPDVLQAAETRYIPNDECSKSFDPSRGIKYDGSFLDDTSLCTHNLNGTKGDDDHNDDDDDDDDDDEGDGCIFDSGGPVIAKKDDDYDDADDDEFLLIGLISFGVDCADPVYPAVNARVSSVAEWIDDVVCQHSIDPPSDFNCTAASRTIGTSSPLSSMLPSRWWTVSSLFWMVALTVVAVTLIAIFVLRKKKTTSEEERELTVSGVGVSERQALLG